MLNSDEASYSIISRSSRTELVRRRLAASRITIPHPDGKDVLIGSTVTNELLVLTTRPPRSGGSCATSSIPTSWASAPTASGSSPWPFVSTMSISTAPTDSKLVNRIFVDSVPSHLAFDAESKTVFVTLQESGRLVAFDLETQAISGT